MDKGREQGNGVWIPCQAYQPGTRPDAGAQALLQSHSAKRGRVKPVYLGVFQKAGTMAMEACRGQPGVSFLS